jgi:hypothetical protein
MVVKKVFIFGDSSLIIGQVKKEGQVLSSSFTISISRIKQMQYFFESIEFYRTIKDCNVHADSMENLATNLTKRMLVQYGGDLVVQLIP